jgi:OFA family oxalate/formate antiporter-like MFS transporter
VVLVGGILFGLGVFLAGYSSSIAWFCVTFGILPGLGSGCAYGAIVATAVRWFPDRRGLASGLAVGALGFGPVVIVPVAQQLMKTTPDPADSVLFTLKVLGIAFFVIICAASIVTVSPPKGYMPAGYVPSPAAKAASGNDYSWFQMISTGRFWLLLTLYVCGAFSGLMIISQAKPIAMEIKNSGLGPDQLKAFAGSVVLILAIANAFGRMLWGAVSDRIGRMPALTVMFLVTAIMMFLLPSLASSTGTIVPAAVLIGVCFGGYLGTFPPICADAFGGRNMTVNYSLLFMGFAVAAIAGPQVAAHIKVGTGSYSSAFIVAGAVAIVGLIISAIMTFAQPKTKQVAA